MKTKEIQPTEVIEKHTARLYDAYCEAVGGKAFNGDPLPKWSEFGSDPAKQKQANAWRVIGTILAEREATLDWAETILCNAIPMPHCSQEDWDKILHNWRDEKHGITRSS